MKTNIFYIIPLLLLIVACRQNTSKESQSETDTTNPLKVSLCTPKITDRDWYLTESKAPLLEGLDILHFPVTTERELVQRYVNQGLVLSYGFNYAEAARSFYYATQLDSSCAMAYWGYAYVLGPNYNAGMESDNYERAYEAIQKAIQLSGNITAKERDMIDAMSTRYVENLLEDKSELDQAYANAVQFLYKRYPEDADIGAMYAEALMNLHPWDIWKKDGTQQPWTSEVMNVLEHTLSIDPDHPGAYYKLN